MTADNQTTQARRFLGLLFQEKPADQHVLIWRLAGRHSRFFKDLDAAAIYAVQQQRDVYFGVGLSPEDFGADKRCPADRITGLAGLWCDLDIFHPAAHAKQNLPPDEPAALKILNQIAVKATVIIHSGYGLQAWWIFKEPWIFAGDEERTRGAALAQRWNQYIRAAAKGQGFDVDSVHDLARVLRIPGTYNGKVADDPKPVRLWRGKEERRYNPSDLAELVADIELPEPSAPAAAGDWNRDAQTGLIINPDRQPPADKMKMLRNSARFRATWDHRRGEFTDQSTSSYDLALAGIAVRHGWSDQEIADLLIAHQMKYPLMTNGQVRGVRGVRDRPRYFQTTIAKARAANAPDPRIARLRQSQAPPAYANGHAPSPTAAPSPGADNPPPPNDPPPPSETGDLLADLSSLLRVKITRVVKQLSQPALYSIETERGKVAIGEVQNLIEQRALRNRLADVGVYLTKRKEEEWEPIATALLQACEPVEVTADATFDGAARAWLRDYLSETVIMDSLEEADRGQNPFVRETTLYISSTALRKFLMTNNGERNLTTRELADSLRTIGAKPKTMFLQNGEHRTSRSLWELPGKPEDYQ